MTDLLTPQEVAEIFRVEVGTLAKWRWQKIGPDYIKIGRMVRYRREVIEAIVNGGSTTPGVT
ncbi:helix-turn-helix domain-containing protein [Microbacterium sp. E-13]|uniref:helix-turn-helix domain-containing protein n=1 Tax=Microbacterium sp. E-13 TaxID=3404048 RepID=UPI003CF1D3A1